MPLDCSFCNPVQEPVVAAGGRDLPSGPPFDYHTIICQGPFSVPASFAAIALSSATMIANCRDADQPISAPFHIAFAIGQSTGAVAQRPRVDPVKTWEHLGFLAAGLRQTRMWPLATSTSNASAGGFHGLISYIELIHDRLSAGRITLATRQARAA